MAMLQPPASTWRRGPRPDWLSGRAPRPAEADWLLVEPDRLLNRGHGVVKAIFGRASMAPQGMIWLSQSPHAPTENTFWAATGRPARAASTSGSLATTVA